MALLLRIAWTHIHTRKRQTLVSLIGVALGVGFYIGISSLMRGFQRYFVNKIIDVSPHVTMRDEFRTPPRQAAEILHPDSWAVEIRSLKPKDELRGIKSGMRIVRELEVEPGIHVAPTLRGQVFFGFGSKDVNVSLVGIDPARERRVTNIESDITQGSLKALFTNPNGVIIGDGVQQKLGAELNDTLTVISPSGIQLNMKVVGVFRTGITSIDNFEAYSLLKKSQILQDRPNVINQIRIRMNDVATAKARAQELERRFAYRTESWEESNKNVLAIFVVQNGISFSSVGAVLIVAAFGIFNIISTVIHEKTRDIAILKSIGFRERDIRSIFLFEGFILGVFGTIIGWALGYGITYGLGQIKFNLEGFVRTQGFVLYLTWKHYAVAGGFAVLASSLAGYIPARKAARLNPVDIIRGAT